jgi:hypothetical protein
MCIEYLGVVRTQFLLDPNPCVLQIFRYGSERVQKSPQLSLDLIFRDTPVVHPRLLRVVKINRTDGDTIRCLDAFQYLHRPGTPVARYVRREPHDTTALDTSAGAAGWSESALRRERGPENGRGA